MAPSAGCLSCLFATISAFRAMRTDSIVYDDFQFLNWLNLVGSTWPFDWFTLGMLIFELKKTSGCYAGYCSPVLIRRK